ncbi:hypothetical protein GQ44DRAFT_723227 [Phaeosphaeriaceae sp. PMI808]|nr:hypothetical protein GQ44DRAFT_723227 [Phaeosphaeriaceae sp. PMI808]
MPANFLSLPRIVRIKIYELLLIHNGKVHPMNQPSHETKFTTALFRANRTVSNEATTVFYARNTFELSTYEAYEISSLFQQIGPRNKSYIQHIILSFPEFNTLDDPYHLSLFTHDEMVIETIRQNCPRLSTLTTSILWRSQSFPLSAVNNPEIVVRALMLVDDRFREITSVQRVIVKVLDDELSDHMRGVIRGLGWVIVPDWDP